MKRDPAVNNLLLAISCHLKKDQRPSALLVKRAWFDVMLGCDPEPAKVTPATARALLVLALQLCDAQGIDRPDQVALFTTRVDAGERATAAQSDELLDEMADALLALLMPRHVVPETEQQVSA